MIRQFETRRVLPIAIAVMAAIGLAGCSGAADIADAVVEEPLRAIGLAPDNRPNIDYTPRSPLVMPSTTELRGPQAPTETAELGPQWPNDPDVLAEQQREALDEWYRQQDREDRNGRGEDTMMPDDLDEWARDAGIAPDTGRRGGVTDRGRAGEVTQDYDPTQRASVRTEAPAQRNSLVEPPLDYRVPAPGGEVAGAEEQTDDRGWLARRLGMF